MNSTAPCNCGYALSCGVRCSRRINPKHDEACRARRARHPYLCTCGITDDEMAKLNLHGCGLCEDEGVVLENADIESTGPVRVVPCPRCKPDEHREECAARSKQRLIDGLREGGIEPGPLLEDYVGELANEFAAMENYVASGKAAEYYRRHALDPLNPGDDGPPDKKT